tara:strand:- start:2614 stop:3081 length:468 start_codon:yes stop_codon:yes gene_type:complete
MNELEKKLMSTINDLVLKKDFFVLNLKLRQSKSTPNISVIVDSSKTVSVDDCAYVSNVINDVLKVDEKFSDYKDFALEVSSPGINRELFTLSDYKKYVGEKVQIKLKKSLNGVKNIKAKLIGVDDGFIEVSSRNETYTLEFDNIKKANLNIDIKV